MIDTKPSPEQDKPLVEPVAIIGMSGRLPGAQDLAEFWQNQLKGVEAISHFTVEELEVRNKAELAAQPNYIRARAILKDIDLFDAEFFGILPKEAEMMDPQQRLFLECCYESFESAGYNPLAYAGAVGVFGGSSYSSYFLSRVCAQPNFIDSFTGEYQTGNYAAMMGNNPDFLATRVSYKLNLRGPSYTMVSGCSSSLVAVCQACQSLLTHQSDMALAGGASITLPQKRGYFYTEGGMGSADGHCRTFDADAQGTVFGSGVAVVLLKRLADAVRDGDQIHAVIRGFAVNNDGAAKIGYTAPGLDGQADVLARAHRSAGINPETIGYLEAHGTATPLGDPIELAAAARAFRTRTQKKHFCVIGTAKTNVGHLDIASGVTGLIHAAHIVREGQLPPTLHFKKPTGKFDFENSPFYVNTSLSNWESSPHPRRAGVSAFGVGGTNAHIVIEQPPSIEAEASPRPAQLLVVSARSASALENATRNLAAHLRKHPETDLADVAYTLQLGRRVFPHRRFVVAQTSEQTANALDEKARPSTTRASRSGNPKVAFLFPGQGSQRPNMGREVYETESVFRTWVDRCNEILAPQLGNSLRDVLYPSQLTDETTCRMTQTLMAQPAIFTVEYALAQLWMSWGIRPSFMLGHSVGEFVAACLAGVLSLEDALHLVAARGRMMQSLPGGAMLSVRLPEQELQPYLTNGLSLAAVNAPLLSVVAGPFEAVEQLESELNKREIANRRLHTSHAFHSSMMDPILDPFLEEARKIRFAAPQIPYVSSVTGEWITAAEATNPEYWAHHFRETVRFSAGVEKFRKMDDALLLEVGPANVLATLARPHIASSPEQLVVSSLTDGTPNCVETTALQSALGQLWLAGVQPDWTAYHSASRRRRISLPTYPFERKRFWLDVPEPTTLPSIEARKTDNNMQAVPQMLQSAPTQAQAQEKIQVTQPNAVLTPNRQSALCSQIVTLVEEMSGLKITASDYETGFLDLGLDSLFLTQVTQALQKQFKVKITFRQLLGDLPDVNSVATYLDAQLPAETLQSASAPAVSAPVAPALTVSHAPAEETAIAQMMREQLNAMNQLFAQQLAALHGTPSTAAPALSPVPVAPATQTSTTPDKADDTAKELKGYSPFKPLQKNAPAELTERQMRHIHTLVETYTSRTAGSKRSTQQYRKVHADPRVVAGFRAPWKEVIYPIVTVRSKGAYLWDVDGNRYIDILNGFGPIMVGHKPDFVKKAIEEQLQEGFEIGPQTLLAGEVAQIISEMTGSERVTFCNTGSEAVIAAMRVARTVTGRNKVVIFAGDYHGMFDEVLVKGFKKGGEPQSFPAAPGIPKEKTANIVVLEYGAADSIEWIRRNADELAAVIVEPVQSRHPDLQPIEFLREIRKITEESGTCFVFDEVVTGFRTHPGGCQALFNIRADLATYGKVLAGGMPIGVLAGKSQFMDALDGGMWQYGDDSYPEAGVTFFAGTFVRHPLTMAATRAMLNHLRAQGPGLQQRLNERTGTLVRRLNALLEENAVPARVENFSSIMYFSFSSDFRFGSLFYYHLRAKGIHLLEGFPCFLTTEHSDADLEEIVQAFRETIAEMQAGDLLPNPPSDPLHKSRVPLHGDQQVLVTATATESPLTEAQREIWLSAQLSDEASCAFNESFTLFLEGTLDRSLLLKSIQTLVDRHESLRATFSEAGDVMRCEPRVVLNTPFTDLSMFNPAERDAQFASELAQDARTPFDLINGPLFRVKLFQIEPHKHAVVFTSHHIVCDGWSTNVLLDELSRLYSGESLEAPVSFTAYARESAPDTDTAETEAYWLKQFPDVPVLDLPTDRPRPAVKSFSGDTYRTRIDTETTKLVRSAGAKQGCTLFVTLLSGCAALLHRLSSQSDVVIGVPTAGQSILENGSLVGHAVNFLPLRTSIQDGQSAAQLLAQTKRTLLDAYEHQSYTYGTLVHKLKLRKDVSRLPLIEVQFNLEKVGSGLRFGDLQARIDPNPKAFVNFDLFVNIVESPVGLSIDCDYNTELFDRETIARWLQYYEVLLRGVAEDANQLVDRLPLLPASERRQLVTLWNSTSADYPRDANVQHLFEAQAMRTPEAIAVTFEDRSLTYEQLNRRANQLAGYLLDLGVQPGDLVGIEMDRSLDMLVALLGIWKAGAAYVPLDPAYPRERLSYILKETAVPVLITQARYASELASTETQLVSIDSEWAKIERHDAKNPPIPADANRTAYVIFTSGSTGNPKGVEVTHRNLVNFLLSMQREPGLAAQDKLLAVTSISFDIAGLELYLPLITGAHVVIANREMAADARLLLKALDSSGITVMQATPATWRMMIESGWRGTSGLKMLCGGEALPQDLADALVERGHSLWNMYGPTETTIWSALARMERDGQPVTLGAPIANTQLYVLDRFAQLQPVGIPGELYIGGEGVARGYFKRADLTHERFIQDPFGNPDGRLYRTGDLVRYRTDGRLEFLGRLDHQVKIRGFRIELGEIETTLLRHPQVREAVVIAREDEPGDKRLAAYIVMEGSEQPTTSILRNWLARFLPDYMTPSYFVFLPALPQTPNGKVDRKQLPAPKAATQNNSIAYTPPRTPIEGLLARICSDVLHLPQVSVDQSLFDLGADSIHLFQIVARARAASVVITPQQILRLKNVSAIAGKAVQGNEDHISPMPEIKPVARDKYRVQLTRS